MRAMDPLDRLKDLKLPFAELLGIRFTAADLDRVAAEMRIRAELCTVPAVAWSHPPVRRVRSAFVDAAPLP